MHPARDAGERINTLLRNHAEKDILLLLSGGSAFAILGHLDTTLFTEKVTVSVVDERYTSEASAQNTTTLLATPFGAALQNSGAHLLDPRQRTGETLEACGIRFDLALKEWHITHHDGIVLATLGIGADGHTSGVLPVPEKPAAFSALFEKKGFCARGYEYLTTENEHKKRITTTLYYLQTHIHHAVVYATGEAKKQALCAALYTTPLPAFSTTPAAVFRSMNNVEVYTEVPIDPAACSPS